MSRLALFCTPQLKHSLAVTDKGAFKVACRLLELRLEARNIKAREGRGALSKLLEGGVGHVGFLLIGVNDGEFQVLSVIAKVRFQFERFAVGGNGLVIPACYVEY